MKQILTLILCFSVAALFAADVPEPVEKAFTKKYSAAKKVIWKEKGSSYEARFKMNGKNMMATYSGEGVLEKTGTGLEKETIPAAIKKVLAKDFEGLRVAEAWKIQEIATKATTFEIRLKSKEEHQWVSFGKDGTVLNKEDILPEEEEEKPAKKNRQNEEDEEEEEEEEEEKPRVKKKTKKDNDEEEEEEEEEEDE